jgi:hypothetical protein
MHDMCKVSSMHSLCLPYFWAFAKNLASGQHLLGILSRSAIVVGCKCHCGKMVFATELVYVQWHAAQFHQAIATSGVASVTSQSFDIVSVAVAVAAA